MGEKGIRKTFKKRWFKVGNDGKLYYFDKKGDLKEKGFIDLTQVISVTASNDSSASEAQKKQLWEFNITTTRRVYKLRSISETEMNRWIDSLSKIVTLVAESQSEMASGRPKSMQLASTVINASARPVTMDFSALGALSSIVTTTPSISKAKEAIDSQTTDMTKSLPVTPSPVEEEIQDSEEIEPVMPVENGPKSRNETPFRMSMNITKSSPSIHVSKQSDFRSSTPQPKQEVSFDESSIASTSSRPQTVNFDLGKGGDKNVANMRNMLEKAKKAIEERDNKIDQLIRDVERLRFTLNEMQSTLDSTKVMNEEIDYERKRREEETQSVRKQLEVETRNREELERRNQEMASEIRTLKETVQNFYQDERKLQLQTNNSIRAQSMRDLPRGGFSGPIPPLLTSNPTPTGAGGGSLQINTLAVRELPDPLEFWKRDPTTWVDDTKQSECKSCRSQFGFFVRRHHCRNCGNIFCDTCSSFLHQVPGYDRLQRVCGPCLKELKMMRQLLEAEL